MQHIARTGSLVLGAAALLALAGCTAGSSGTPSATATVAKTAAASSSSSTPTPSPSCGTEDAGAAVSAAVARVPLPEALRGVATWDTAHAEISGYDPCAALSWAVVTVEGGTPSSPYAILLFHDGTFLGTATKVQYAFGPEVSRTSDHAIAVTYRYAKSGDANADPTGRASATYTWDAGAGAVVMGGDTPPAS